MKRKSGKDKSKPDFFTIIFFRVPSEDQRGYKSFKFDKVLQEETTQDQMFAKTQIQDLVSKVVEVFS